MSNVETRASEVTESHEAEDWALRIGELYLFGLRLAWKPTSEKAKQNEAFQALKAKWWPGATTTGFLALPKILPSVTKFKAELCSGNGEWLAAQAKHDPTTGWIAMEIRHDRVYQVSLNLLFDSRRN